MPVSIASANRFAQFDNQSPLAFVAPVVAFKGQQSICVFLGEHLGRIYD